MTYFAVEALGEAYKRTKTFFFAPFNLKKWLKLGIVGILGGIIQQGGGYNCNSGGGGGNSGNNGGSSGVESYKKYMETLEKIYHEHTTMIYAMAGIIVLMLIAVSLIFTYIKSSMFFIFMESLIQKDVTIMRSFGNIKGKALSLFLFRVLTGFITLIIMVIILLPLLLHIWHIAHNPSQNLNIWALVSNFILSFVALIILLIITNFINSLNHDFACAIVYAKDCGLIKGWSDLINLIINKPLQFIVYYVIKVCVAIGISTAMLFILIPVTLILIPLYLILGLIMIGIGVGIYFLWTAVPILGMIAAVVGFVLLIVFCILIGYVFFCPFLPIYAFFRYYALSFLEKLDNGFSFSEAHYQVGHND